MHVLRHYAAIFLTAGVPFGAIALLIGAGAGGVEGAKGGAVVGAIFGGVMAITLGTLSVLRQRALGLDLHSPLGPRQTETITAPAQATQKDDLHQQVRAAFRVLNLNPGSSFDGEGAVIGRTSATAWSLGTEVRADVREGAVTFSTSPTLGLTVADYGEGRLLIRSIASYLQQSWGRAS